MDSRICQTITVSPAEPGDFPLRVNWHEIIEFQYVCLKSGANGVGIPDLLIAQHALQHGYAVYSLDKHFKLLNQLLKLKLYSIED